MPDHLPPEHVIAHDLSFLFHDAILRGFVSGSKNDLFGISIDVEEGEEPPSSDDPDVFLEWLRSNRPEQAYTLLARVSLSGLLSDFCHFVYEGLSCLRKAKLTVAYALLRKPFLETLFVLESMVLDERRFARDLTYTPEKVPFESVAGVTKHSRRIEQVLRLLPQGTQYDPAFVAQLRYDKGAYDGFNAYWQRALHLITTHKHYKTEPQNINFVFSGWSAWATQWAYAYGRLPYLLSYTRDIAEVLFGRLAPSDASYLELVQRRADAGTILWHRNLMEDYRHVTIDRFAQAASERLGLAARKDGREVRLDERWLRHVFYENTWPAEHIKTLRDRMSRSVISGARSLSSVAASVFRRYLQR